MPSKIYTWPRPTMLHVQYLLTLEGPYCIAFGTHSACIVYCILAAILLALKIAVFICFIFNFPLHSICVIKMHH